jgi:predicted alpha/beta superfamily hydrolase
MIYHQILVKGMQIPNLHRRRRIWVCLPSQYQRDEKRRYPVLYIQDAQNVFEPWRAAYGQSWNIHHTLNHAHMPQVIVIAIEHAGKKRIAEYRPWLENGSLSEGDVFSDFMANILKPYVDKKLRTLREPEHNGLMGSSMGGLISLYTAIKHPSFFGKAAIFSPSLWIAPQIYDFADQLESSHRSRFYFLVGGGEGHQTVAKTKAMQEKIALKGFETQLVVRPHETHNEGFWGREFEAAFRWLYSSPTNL